MSDVNYSDNFSLAGLVPCSYEGLLFRLDLLKLLGQVVAEAAITVDPEPQKWSQNCSAPPLPTQVQGVLPHLATDSLDHLLYYQASALMPTLTTSFSASQG